MKFIGSFAQDLKSVCTSDLPQDFNALNTWLASTQPQFIWAGQDKSCVIFGRIYNASELMTAYEGCSNAAELAVKMFAKHGPESWKKLDGEYTMIIKESDQTLIYRDRHGAGPQVYFNATGFTSHQHQLRLFNDFTAEPDLDHLALFLQIGYIPAPDTALKGVSKIPAGFMLTCKNGQTSLKDFYGYADFGKADQAIQIDEKEATEEYERLHKKAIKDRVGDAKRVQLLLSGGYDSGGNISALRDIYDGPVSSYSIGFKDNEWSELPLARILSDVFKTEHKDYEINGVEIDNLPAIIREFGDPFNENGVLVNYTAMRLVSENKGEGIILGGDGNDQHFGTAGKELAMNFKYRKNGIAVGQKIVSAFSGMSLFEKDSMFFKVRFHNEKVQHILQSDNFGFRKNQIPKLFNSKIDLSKPDYLKALPKSIKGFDEFYNVHNYFGDIKQVINEVILFKAARLSGHFGGRMSFPYMSTDLYNFLKTLPRELKFKGTLEACAKGGGKTKFLHKNYLYPKLPKEITERKKQGGFAPLPIFLQNTAQFDKIAAYILKSELVKNHMNEGYIKAVLNQYKNEKDSPGYWFWYRQVRAFQIINLLVAATWYDIMVNGELGSDLGLGD